MRIAICGAHATGKSTLVSELAKQLPDHTSFDEPYHQLADDGHRFGDPPTTDDFQALCDSANSLMRTSDEANAIFDRSPVDYLAYLLALDAQGDWRYEVSEALESIATLDLIVFVGIEDPDVIDGAERPKLRRRVDRRLREILLSGEWELPTRVIVVRGTPSERAKRVLRAIQAPG